MLWLKVRRTDIISVLRRRIDIFGVNAATKGITLQTYGLEGTCVVWLDEDKQDKIFANLMSNALKFTPGGGRIEVRFDVIRTRRGGRALPRRRRCGVDALRQGLGRQYGRRHPGGDAREDIRALLPHKQPHRGAAITTGRASGCIIRAALSSCTTDVSELSISRSGAVPYLHSSCRSTTRHIPRGSARRIRQSRIPHLYCCRCRTRSCRRAGRSSCAAGRPLP